MRGTGRLPLLPFEWAALAVLSALLAVRFFWIQLLEGTWLLGIILLVLLWIIGLALAGGGVIFAAHDAGPISHRVRGAVAVPAALVLAFVLSGPVLWLGYAALGEWRLRWHGGAYAAAVARAPHAPRAFKMLEGIPDGGVSLIYLPGRSPVMLNASEAVDLVGERIRRCQSLRRDWHVCDFD